jgi:hypothetical protein
LSISRRPPWFLAINWSFSAIKVYCPQVLMLPAVDCRIRKDILKIGTDLQAKKIQFVRRACKTAAVFVLQLWILIGFAIRRMNL